MPAAKPILLTKSWSTGKTLTNKSLWQHWAWIVLGWVTAWELRVLLTKTKAGLRCRIIQAKKMGGKLFQGVQALGKSGLCFRQLAGNWIRAMKMAKSCKEGTAKNQRRSGAEGHMFKIRCQQGLFAVIDVIDVT